MECFKGGSGDTGMIETINSEGSLYAIIIPHDFSQPGVNFFTPHNLSPQLAFISHPPGRQIEPHVHNPVPREVLYTQEVLMLRKGRLRVDYYDDVRALVTNRVLVAGSSNLHVAEMISRRGGYLPSGRGLSDEQIEEVALILTEEISSLE